MKKFYVIPFLLLLLIPITPVQSDNGHLYTKEKHGYNRIESETFRFDQKTEVFITDYSFSEINDSKYVNFQLVDDQEYGLSRNISHLLKPSNFEFELFFTENGSLSNVDFTINFFRLAETAGSALPSGVSSDFTRGRNTVYDSEVTETSFKVSLTYYEIHEINGEEKRIQVNTELVTDNHDDGRIIRSALHIVKRDTNDNILFDFNLSIKEVDTLYRILNKLDQPFLKVPIFLGVVFLIVYIYIRVHRYWKENGYKIIKEKQDEEQKEGSTENGN